MNAQPVAVMLKDSTQQLHVEVENLLQPRLAGVQHRTDYEAILRLFYGYFSPLENLVHQYITPSLLPDVFERRKASSILHDLAAMGCETKNIVLCDDLPEITNRFEALGALYVMEGSTLGGKMIAKMLLKNPALSITENELAFFSGYKEETGSKWKTFLTVLNQQPDAALITKTANQTFYQLKIWIKQFYGRG